jgi:hypothetical protein
VKEAEVYVYEDHRGNRAVRAVRAVQPAHARRSRVYAPGDTVGRWTIVEYAGSSTPKKRDKPHRLRPSGKPRSGKPRSWCASCAPEREA